MIKRLDWDSSFFDIEVAEALLSGLETVQAKHYDLLVVKAEEQDKPIQISGFDHTFSEVKVFFEKVPMLHDEDGHIYTVQKHENREPLYELAYESGKYSRFKKDMKFGTEKFEQLYREWVDNSLDKGFSDEILCYSVDGNIAGMVTYKISEHKAAIGLIAVAPGFQGRGIGRKLLQHVENVLIEKNIHILKIPTQQSNEPACTFYSKAGYTITDRTQIMHYWKK